MVVSEIFCSLQGEGILVGTSSVFVRTSGCNLRCNWCDTPYASWDPEGEELSVAQIVERVTAYDVRHCVLTGGEPMIAPGIHDLAAALRDAGLHITIETAGTIAPEGIACDLASLSPKLSNSTPDDRLPASWKKRHERDRLQPTVIDRWLAEYDSQLKFVVAAEQDVEEIDSLLRDLRTPILPDRVLLMPEGVTVAQLRARTDFIMKLCRERGFRYGSRLHIELFGNTRGT